MLLQMLEFTRHQHLPLATVTLSFWGSLVREAGAVPGPARPPPCSHPGEKGWARRLLLLLGVVLALQQQQWLRASSFLQSAARCVL